MSEYPEDIIQVAAELANATIRNYERNECANVSRDAISAAIDAERENWKSAVEDQFDAGQLAERTRCAEIVTAWKAKLNGSEYLTRQTSALFEQIRGGAEIEQDAKPEGDFVSLGEAVRDLVLAQKSSPMTIGYRLDLWAAAQAWLERETAAE